MKVHGLLSFFDEPVEDLVACITALADTGVSHIVAMDGRYARYPSEETASHPNQHAAIALTCRELGLACTLHVPSEPWTGEPEKRTAHFKLAWSLAEPGDWFWVQDADMVVTRHPDDLLDRLETTDCTVAQIELLDVVALRAQIPNWPPTFSMCSLFRAQPITVGPHHATYRGADGNRLWIGNDVDPPVPALDLSDVVRVEHRTDHRPVERQQGKLVYYRQRDESLVEREMCRCGEPSVRLVPVRWRRTYLDVVADWREACERCADRLDKVGRRQLLQLGEDPSIQATAESRNGKAPEGMTA